MRFDVLLFLAGAITLRSSAHEMEIEAAARTGDFVTLKRLLDSLKGLDTGD